MKHVTRFDRWLQRFHDDVKAFCEACANNDMFFLALLLNCLALAVVWFMGLAR